MMEDDVWVRAHSPLCLLGQIFFPSSPVSGLDLPFFVENLD